MIADAISRRDGAPPPRCGCSAPPCDYIHHGKPDEILADLGLDAAGLAPKRPLAPRERSPRRASSARRLEAATSQ